MVMIIFNCCTRDSTKHKCWVRYRYVRVYGRTHITRLLYPTHHLIVASQCLSVNSLSGYDRVQVLVPQYTLVL